MKTKTEKFKSVTLVYHYKNLNDLAGLDMYTDFNIGELIPNSTMHFYNYNELVYYYTVPNGTPAPPANKRTYTFNGQTGTTHKAMEKLIDNFFED